MRAGDAAAPTIPAHPIPPDQPSASWTGKPIVGLEYLPTGDTWDDRDSQTVVWGNPAVTWDDPLTASGFTDVWCDTTGVEVVHGEPDDNELLPPSRCTLTLYDPTGKYRRRTPDGRLVYYAAGRRLCVFGDDGLRWWLFHGRVASWHELPEGMIEIVAYSTTAALAQPPGRDWSAGVDGDRLGARAAAIVAGSGIAGVTVKADAGIVTLVKPPAAADAALEMLQRAAWSDGGIVYADADDAVAVRDRTWRNGRADQAATRTVFTDNVCSVPGAVVVWDPEYAHDDEWLAASVTLSTDAGLVATAANPTELVDPRLRFTHPDRDLWRTQAEGDALAAWIASLRGTARPALGLARVHLHDSRLSPAVWRAMLDLRLGDQIRWQHVDDWPDGATVLVDVTLVAVTVRHLLTAETWTVELETSPAVAYTTVGMWDLTAWRWDSTDPAADWR
jgi:hypothetical protein